MKKRKAAVFVLLVGAFLSISAWGADIHVPGDFGTIQAAVDAAENGDTVHMAPGTYIENVRIFGKSVNLVGSGKTTTVIDGNRLGSVVHLFLAPSVTISGFTLRNANLSSPFAGILQDQSSNSTISGNIIMSAARGISLMKSHDCLIADNEIEQSTYQALLVWNSSSNTIDNNRIAYNTTSSNLISLGAHSPNNTISNNLIENTSENGIDITQTLNPTTITGNTIRDCGNAGIYINQADEYIIRDNTIIHCEGTGISIHNSSYNTIERNIVVLGGSGIGISACRENRIAENLLEGSGYFGIGIYDGLGDDLIDNCISGFKRGIRITGGETEGSHSTFVSGNVIGNNTVNAIELGENRYGVFLNNLIVNTAGTAVEAEKSNASFNKFYKNSFTGNTVDVEDSGVGTTWDNGLPDGGNFWSDYTGIDRDGDGFGDSPLLLPGSNNGTDRYPRMVPHGGGLLYADTYLIRASTGGIVNLKLEAAENNASRYYLILGSLTGTQPGIPLPGGLATLPLTWDFLTDLILANFNSPTFNHFFGVLNASGKANAQFHFNQPMNPVFINRSIYFAYPLADPGPFDYISQVMEIKIVDD